MNIGSKGFNQASIARALKISEPTVCRDLIFLKEQAKQNIQRFIDDRLPYEYSQTLDGLTAILREAWAIAGNGDIDRREKIQALSLAKEVYSTKLELLTNCTVVDDVIKFINNHKNKSGNTRVSEVPQNTPEIAKETGTEAIEETVTEEGSNNRNR